MRTAARIGVVIAALVVVILVADSWADAVMAQGAFGGARGGSTDPQVGGVLGWLLDMQSKFYLQMSATIRAAKSDGRAVWTLLGISFAYGIFHAAGPGHGKAVISSYLIANEETARRGIVLAFISALLQALVAILIVGVGAWLFNVTARTLCGAERGIEIASYALIAAFGARLLWVKGGGFVRAFRSKRVASTAAMSPTLAPALVPALDMAEAPVHSHASLAADASGHVHHGHETHAHHHSHDGHHHHHHHAAAHGEPGHVHDEHCGHHHGPTPDQLAGPGGWRRGLGAIFAVGLRPCSGAILVLVFALAQGMFWAGIAAAFLMGLGTAITVATIASLAVFAKGLAQSLSARRNGGGVLILRGLEAGAASLILLFGVGLLLGLVAAERVTCF
jgi:ABC-type nickel/cobalt efflux system permease component RcnA